MIEDANSFDRNRSNSRYHYILHYYDVRTRFSFLKKITDLKTETVARKLRKIFCIIGAPHCLIGYDRCPTESILGILDFLQAKHYPNLKIIVDDSQRLLDPNTVMEIEKILDILSTITCDPSWPEQLDDLQYQLNNNVSLGLKANRKSTPNRMLLHRETQFGFQTQCFGSFRNEDLVLDELLRFCQNHLDDRKSFDRYSFNDSAIIEDEK